jgi:hypothetical protein
MPQGIFKDFSPRWIQNVLNTAVFFPSLNRFLKEKKRKIGYEISYGMTGISVPKLVYYYQNDNLVCRLIVSFLQITIFKLAVIGCNL